LAIVFSLLGDVALMLQLYNELYFIIGLGSFLVAHLYYLNAYHQHRNEADSNALLGVQKFRFSLPIVLFGTGLITVLYSHLGDFKIPVILYAFVLILMVLQALFRFGHTTRKSFTLVFIGALLFMISDSFIAINKFLNSFESAQLVIMSTYLIAQFFIIKGLIAHAENTEQ
jgi:uncharacterized membrane protein YhhN